MPVQKKNIEKSSKGGASSKKTAPLKASVKPKAKRRSTADHHTHIVERDFIIITSGGFLVVVMVFFLLFS